MKKIIIKTVLILILINLALLNFTIPAIFSFILFCLAMCVIFADITINDKQL
jgi:hypothetical protein